MALDVDKYLDRRRLKRSRGWWRVVACIAILALAVVAFGSFHQMKSGDHVAVVDIRNIIVDDPQRDDMIKEIAVDPEAKALIVHI